MKPFQIIDHTADLRLRASGHDLEELFGNAALGLAAIFVADAPLIKRPGNPEKVCLAAEVTEILLVTFLNEILTRSQTNKKLYTRAKILRLSEKSIDAQIFGVPISGFDRDVKAVSYHNGAIETKRGILTVQLVVDI